MVGSIKLQALLENCFPDGADSHLLECFIDNHDEGAFEGLVRRHGPMVLGVCQRLLRSRHDAEDAFQATFLVLVRKADTIVPREMLANWLYGVAYHTALKARAMSNRRAVKERPMPLSEPEALVPDESLWSDLRKVIDEELSRLPDKYRVPIVLCDLENCSYKAAAKRLGWREGTLAGRLSRARELLSQRLVRRGVTLSAAILASTLQQSANASVPVGLIAPVVKAAAAIGSGQLLAGAVSLKVSVLAQTVSNGLFVGKLKAATGILLAVASLGTGTTFVGGAFEKAPSNESAERRATPVLVASATTADAVPQTQDNAQTVDANPMPRVDKGLATTPQDEPKKRKSKENNEKGEIAKVLKFHGVITGIDDDQNNMTLAVRDNGVESIRKYEIKPEAFYLMGNEDAGRAEVTVGARVAVKISDDGKSIVRIQEVKSHKDSDPSKTNNKY